MGSLEGDEKAVGPVGKRRVDRFASVGQENQSGWEERFGLLGQGTYHD